MRVSASKSLAIMTRTFFSFASEKRSTSSGSAPSVSGYWTRIAKHSASLISLTTFFTSNSLTAIPSGLARVWTTAFVCGCAAASIRKIASSELLDVLLANVIASAAAVASSSIDAFAIARPVKSLTIVWKANSASNLP